MLLLMKFGYARVSTTDQNLNLQRDALTTADCERIFEEKISSRVAERPALQKLRDLLRPGDEIVVYKLDRIARSTRELLDILDGFLEQDVTLTSLREPWLNTGGSAMDKLMRTMIAGFAEFERDLIRQRTADGRAAAKVRGVRFGRKSTITPERKAAIIDMRETGKTVPELVKTFGLGRSTIYRILGETGA